MLCIRIRRAVYSPAIGSRWFRGIGTIRILRAYIRNGE